MQHYLQPVSTMTDAELNTLSDELEREYCREVDDYPYWTDEEAEARYNAMRREINIRWELANPEAVVKRPQFKEMMSEMVKEFNFQSVKLARCNARYEREFLRDTIKIREPQKYRIS